jgi:hypothetical protein
MTQPVKGFADPAISTMFNPPPATSLPTDQASRNSTGASLLDRQKERNTIIGIIAGVIVGCVLITAIAIYALRRRKREINARKREEHQFFAAKELGTDSQPSSPLELGGEFANIKELETESPVRELAAAEIRIEADAKESQLYELESPAEPRHRSDSKGSVF